MQLFEYVWAFIFYDKHFWAQDSIWKMNSYS